MTLLSEYVDRLAGELEHTPFGADPMLLGIVTEAAWRAGGCTCTRRGGPLDDGNPVYVADVTCPVHPVRCRTNDSHRHDPPTALVDGEPRCDFCQRVIGDQAQTVTPLPA
jgi:hypothetical protein